MRIVFILSSLFLTIVLSSTANAQTFGWRYRDSVPGFPKKIVTDSHGNVLMAFLKSDSVVVTKVSAAGTSVWRNYFSRSVLIGINDLAVGADGSAYICGGYAVGSNSGNAFLIKLDSNGITQWVDTFDMSGGQDGYKALHANNDGTILVTGVSGISGGKYVLTARKFSSEGNEVFTYTYAPSASAYQYEGFKILTDTANNIYIGGLMLDSAATFNFIALKLNNTGLLQWDQTISSPGYVNDAPLDMVMDKTGNLYMAGYTTEGTELRRMIVKLANDGSIVWNIPYDLVSSNATNYITALDDSDNLYVCGYDSAKIGFIGKVNVDTGDTLWNFHMKSIDSELNDMVITHGAIYACGASETSDPNGDAYIIKLSLDGEQLWADSLSGNAGHADFGLSLSLYQNNLYVSVSTQEIPGQGTCNILKYTELFVGIFQSPINAPLTVCAYPNPTANQLQFTIDMVTAGEATMNIYDINGKQITTVFNQQMTVGKNTAVWDVSSLAKGTYLYELITPGGKSTGKFVKF